MKITKSIIKELIKEERKKPKLKLNSKVLDAINELLKPHGLMLTQIPGQGLGVLKISGRDVKGPYERSFRKLAGLSKRHPARS